MFYKCTQRDICVYTGRAGGGLAVLREWLNLMVPEGPPEKF